MRFLTFCSSLSCICILNSEYLWNYSALSELIYFAWNIVMCNFWYYGENVVLDIFSGNVLVLCSVLQYLIYYHRPLQYLSCYNWLLEYLVK
jgi:hypothetical protein